MTHTTLQAILALTAAALSLGTAIGGLAMAPRHVVHRTFAVAMACLAVMQLGAGLSVQAIFWERLQLLASAGFPGLGLLFCVCFARFNAREHVRAWRWAMPIAFALPLGLVTVQPMQVPLNWAGYGFYMLMLVTSMAIVAELEKTLRASTGNIRAQIKICRARRGLCVCGAGLHGRSDPLVGGTARVVHNP